MIEALPIDSKKTTAFFGIKINHDCSIVENSIMK